MFHRAGREQFSRGLVLQADLTTLALDKDPHSTRVVRSGQVPVGGTVTPGRRAGRDLVDEHLGLDEQGPLDLLHPGIKGM